MNQNPGWLPPGASWPGSEVHQEQVNNDQPSLTPYKYFSKERVSSIQTSLEFLSDTKVDKVTASSTDENTSKLEVHFSRSGKPYVGSFVITQEKGLYSLDCYIQSLYSRPAMNFSKQRPGLNYLEVENALILAVSEAFRRQDN